MKTYSISSDSYFRTKSKRSARRKRTKKFTLAHFILLFIIISLLTLGIIKSAEFLFTWEYLNVKSFKLINPPILYTKEIKAILKKYKDNILTVNMSQLEKEFLKFKEIIGVEIKRILPDKLEISFKLRKPEFLLINKNKTEILDREGIVIADKKVKKLIKIINVKKDYIKKILKDTDELLKMKQYIEYITYKRPYGLVLKIKNLNEFFYCGEINFLKKINFYLKIKKKIAVPLRKIKVVDLRFKDRIYIEYSKEEKKNG